ncbi:hypothetical protein LTR33_013202, partial [Friedmanniomyces endolithicus]
MILRALQPIVARRLITRQATKRLLSSSAPQSPPSPTQPVVPLQPIITTPTSTHPQSPHQYRDKIVAYRAEGGPKRYDDTLWLYTTIGSLAAMPFIVYYYYESRKKHMNELRYKKLGEAQESQAGPRKRKDWAGGTLEDEVLSFEHDFKERSTTQSPMPEQTAGADLWLTTDPSGT